MKYGPTHGELIFRLVFSLAGLAFMGVALAIHGVPSGPAFLEVGLLAGGFFGGTAVWTARKLLKTPKD